MKPKLYGETLPVRLQAEVDSRLKRIAKAAGISKSDALRMAINHGLPRLEAGQIRLTQSA